MYKRQVSEETRNHIIGVMKRVDYIPNPSAKSLSTGYTKTILCVIPTLCNEFFNQLVEGSQAVLRLSLIHIYLYLFLLPLHSF